MLNIFSLIRKDIYILLVFLITSCYQQEKDSSEKNPGSFPGISIREFGVLPDNDPALNRDRLQAAINKASQHGAALFVEPSEDPYPVAGGLILKMNVSLIGVHGPVGRGSCHPSKKQPVGSVFKIEDEDLPFITVESATQIKGIQFWYSKQTRTDPEKIIPYPPTIKVSQERFTQGVTLSCLTFYGEYFAMDFTASKKLPCEQIIAEHCYGYPLSGKFFHIDYCYDIPRVLHCHVNPANRRLIDGAYSPEIIDNVVAKGTFTYSVDHTDNAVLMDIFTFGAYGGVKLGPASYGQLTSFNLDCVTVGIHKYGDGTFNRNWQIAQGSIIANTGEKIENIHPVIIEGQGHTAISQVEAFSGHNPALTTHNQSADFLLVQGDKYLTVTLYGCRMRNYRSSNPITVINPLAKIRAVASIDKEEQFYDKFITPK